MSADELRELADHIIKRLTGKGRHHGAGRCVDVARWPQPARCLATVRPRNHRQPTRLSGNASGGGGCQTASRRLRRRRQERYIPSSEFCEWAFPENPFEFVLSKNIHFHAIRRQSRGPATIELVKRRRNPAMPCWWNWLTLTIMRSPRSGRNWN